MARSLPSIWRLLRSATDSAGSPSVGRRAYRLLVATLLAVAIVPMELVNRLALWLDEVLFPRYRHVEIRRPLFIVGPPRSGTTLLHRLIAADTDQFTTFPLWELLFAPALCQKYFWAGLFRVDAWLGGPWRRTLSVAELWTSRSFSGLHPTSLSMPEEDYLLLVPDRACFLFVLAFPHCEAVWAVGHFDRAVAEPERRRVLRRYRRLVQRHLYFRGTSRTFLSKNPSFSGWLQSLQYEFADGRFIGLLRKPEETLPSQLSSVQGAMRCCGYDVRRSELVRPFRELFAWYYTHVIENLSRLPAQQARLVRYQDLKAVPDVEVMQTLRRLGYRVSEDYARELAPLAEGARSYRSGHHYALSDFGLSEQQLRQQFASAYAWCVRGDKQPRGPYSDREDAEHADDFSEAARPS